MIYKNSRQAFSGIYATSITTSAHFYDHTAHNYIRAVSEDMGFNYLDGFSAGMDDLLKKATRENLIKFAEGFYKYADEKLPTERIFEKIREDIPQYLPGDIIEEKKVEKNKILLITDQEDGDYNLDKMTQTLLKSIKRTVEVINLNKIDIKGGCLGCLNCALKGKCVYNDDYESFFNEKIVPADAVIFAGKIKDRYFSSKWKQFYDRAFFNGHKPVFSNKQIAYMISGPLKQNANLKEIIDASMATEGTNMISIVTDEYEDSKYIDRLIKNLADRIVEGIGIKLKKPVTFLGEGAIKVLRDLVYEVKFIFKGDYEYYVKHGYYNYPNKNIKIRLQNFLYGILFKIPPVRDKVVKNMRKYTMARYEKYIK